jgi:hypothetical protein
LEKVETLKIFLQKAHKPQPAKTYPLEPVSYLNECGLASGFFVQQGKKPQQS